MSGVSVELRSRHPSRQREESCRVQGYAAVFDAVDRAGDVIRAGAFADCASVPLLLQHRGAPVGTLSSVSEDRQGLRVAGVVTDPQVAALLRRRALTGLSVGYRATRARQGAWREVLGAELVEVSLVAVPMQPAARVETVSEI